MSTIERSVEVNVPVRTAYNQWTQFEDFPAFMDGVDFVEQRDTRHVHWRVDLAGRIVEWDAEITEQTPDEIIAWRSTAGAPIRGFVRFESTSLTGCRIELHLDYEPNGPLEKAADWLGIPSRRAAHDLARFKDFIETRGVETGAFRGLIRSASPAH